MKETDHLGESTDGRIMLQWMLNTIKDMDWQRTGTSNRSCTNCNETSVSLESEKFIYNLSYH